MPLPPQVLVIGGANVDMKLRTSAPAVPATSNPGTSARTPGGVARNVAENLARLGVRAALLAAVGDDPLGDEVLRITARAGVDVTPTLRVPGTPTGSYTAVLDDRGELVIAVAAMEVMDALTPAALDRQPLRGPAFIVADGNLPPEALARLLTRAAEAGARVVFEPVSVPKAARARATLALGNAPWAVTPNVAELAALVGTGVADEPAALHDAARTLHGQGVEVVWVRRGARGSVLSTPDASQVLPALPADVLDVTGAGDAMLAAFLAARLAGEPLLQAAREGHAAAALTVESAQTVAPGLSRERLRARLGRVAPD